MDRVWVWVCDPSLMFLAVAICSHGLLFSSRAEKRRTQQRGSLGSCSLPGDTPDTWGPVTQALLALAALNWLRPAARVHWTGFHPVRPDVTGNPGSSKLGERGSIYKVRSVGGSRLGSVAILLSTVCCPCFPPQRSLSPHLVSIKSMGASFSVPGALPPVPPSTHVTPSRKSVKVYPFAP